MNQNFVKEVVERNPNIQKGTSQFLPSNIVRASEDLNLAASKIVDFHWYHNAQFHYFLIKSSQKTLTLHLSEYESISKIIENSQYGIIIKAASRTKQFSIWLPSTGIEIIIDSHHRISSPQSTNFSYKWEFFPKFKFNAKSLGKENILFALPCIIFEDPNGIIFEEFNEKKDIEKKIFKKSDWFFADKPSDLWNYLINGSFYDPRRDKTINKRFKCQQCALAWWDYFGYLYRQTGKTLYNIIQDEIAFCVLMDMSAEGRWGHGYWSDNIESHSRFHLDGIQLLLNQYEKTNDNVWSDAAELGMQYIIKNLTNWFHDNSIWFLHDTIENEAKHHFDSTIFGKSSFNSLTINTHVQALTVIHRLAGIITDNKIYNNLFEKGCQALRQVLDYAPAEIIYRLVSLWILKNKTIKKPFSTAGKIRYGIENRLLLNIYWKVQRLFPRLVHPNGFIERDLTLSFSSDRYHLINVKDLLLLLRLTGLPWLKLYIERSFDYLIKFVNKVGLDNAVNQSPFFIEYIDILYLYSNYVNSLDFQEIQKSEEIIFIHTGGYSLDRYAYDHLWIKTT